MFYQRLSEHIGEEVSDAFVEQLRQRLRLWNVACVSDEDILRAAGRVRRRVNTYVCKPPSSLEKWQRKIVAELVLALNQRSRQPLSSTVL